MTLMQEAQMLLYDQSEANLEAIVGLLRVMSASGRSSARAEKKQVFPAVTGGCIGAAKGVFVLPPDFERKSDSLNGEIAALFNGENK